MQKTTNGHSGKRKRVAQALMIGSGAFALIPIAPGALDTQDITVEWTDAGKSSPQSAWPSGRPRMTWSLCRPVSL